MKRVMILGIIASLALLLAPVTAISAPAGPPGGLEVKIVDQPVEITGEVDATVTGDVNVVNDAEHAIPVTVQGLPESTRSPVSIFLGDSSPGNAPVGSFYTDSYEVPNGFRLVVEYVSFQIFVDDPPSDFAVSLKITHSANSGSSSHSWNNYIPITVAFAGGPIGFVDYLYTASQSTKIYVYPGGNFDSVSVSIYGLATAPPGSASCHEAILNGYLEPM